MLKQYCGIAGRFLWGIGDLGGSYPLREVIHRFVKYSDGKTAASNTLELAEIGWIRRYLENARDLALELDLESVPPSVERILRKIGGADHINYTLQEAADDLEELRGRVLDQLDSRYFLFVKRSNVSLYQVPDQFGAEVSERFPTAIDDVEGASKCLALGLGTACVLHLMRVMEVGLKAMALPLGIPYAPSWESYLKQIQEKISAQHQSKSDEWKCDEPFFRDLSGDLICVKQAWRNPTMHVVRKYSAEEAEEIFRAVRTFMKRLENGLPKPLAVGA